jgi:hypothetical protein
MFELMARVPGAVVLAVVFALPALEASTLSGIGYQRMADTVNLALFAQ